METIARSAPATHGHPGADYGRLMDATAYLSVVAGYLVGVLTAPHLSLLPFVLFSLFQVAWIGVFRLLTSDACEQRLVPRYLTALVALTTSTLLLTWLGMGLDWLLPACTVSLLALMLPWRAAVGGAALLALVTFGILAQVEAGQWSAFGSAVLSLGMAYIFVAAFSLVIRRQNELRERAEALAAALTRSTAELEGANARLHEFSAQVEELAITRERNRLAREIHDSLGHYLTILAVQLETAAKLEERDDPRLHAELVEARRVVSECLTAIRHSVAALRPADLNATSFGEVLRRLVAEFEVIAPDTRVTLDLDGPVREIAPEASVVLYRCAQEALTNVRKHARATRVLVRLRVEPETVELTVLDNGAGPTTATGTRGADGRADGYGLVGMRERVDLLGGTIAVGSEPERGWRVEIRVPRLSAFSSGALKGAGTPPPVASTAPGT